MSFIYLGQLNYVKSLCRKACRRLPSSVKVGKFLQPKPEFLQYAIAEASTLQQKRGLVKTDSLHPGRRLLHSCPFVTLIRWVLAKAGLISK